jgi:hypothetical protein
MLHKQRLPDKEYRDLRHVYYVMIRFLLWLLRKADAIHLDDKAVFEQKFGKPLGRWFYDRIWTKKQAQTDFGKKVSALLDLAQADPTQASVAATYLCNDIRFYKNWDKPGYGLKYPLLPSPWKAAINAVCIPFYEKWFSGDAFKKPAFSIKDEVMNRTRLMRAFRSSGTVVCGYCDGELGNVGSGKEANDCEHFFPKSEFPHLCIHPRNLYVSCKGCNETWKLDYAPMGIADPDSLNKTYHPEYRPGAQRILCIVQEKADRSYMLLLEDGEVTERVETLDKCLDLNARWSYDVNERLRQNISEWVSESVMTARRRGVIDEQEIDNILSDSIFYREQRVGKTIRTIREIAVLRYQRSSQLAEILALCAGS